jgi:hypothetical protein
MRNSEDEMDATKKQRVGRITITHLVVSLVIIFYLPNIYGKNISTETGLMSYALQDGVFFEVILKFLQPLFFSTERWANLNFYAVVFTVVPIWSLCFAWFFIRTKDWLSHFPVLGKRVF